MTATILHDSPSYRIESEVTLCEPYLRALTFYSTVKPPHAKHPERRVAYRIFLTRDQLNQLYAQLGRST